MASLMAIAPSVSTSWMILPLFAFTTQLRMLRSAQLNRTDAPVALVTWMSPRRTTLSRRRVGAPSLPTFMSMKMLTSRSLAPTWPPNGM
uniref:Putative secreted protein n=1 Tax=Ixodes ricinus TaxID=34613 RepID=A0A6B0U0C9_IXORI